MAGAAITWTLAEPNPSKAALLRHQLLLPHVGLPSAWGSEKLSLRGGQASPYSRASPSRPHQHLEDPEWMQQLHSLHSSWQVGFL